MKRSKRIKRGGRVELNMTPDEARRLDAAMARGDSSFHTRVAFVRWVVFRYVASLEGASDATGQTR